MAHHPSDEFTEWHKNLVRSVIAALYDTALFVKEQMSEEGKPIEYPVQWDSELQKRAFFATGGFGSGIPYQRMGLYVTSIQVVKQPFGARYFAPHPAGAIGGTFSGWQSNIHRGRWKHLPTVIREAIAMLPDRIREHVRVSEGNLDANS